MPGPALRKCMYCRERAVSPTTLPSYIAALEHDGRKYPVVVEDFRVLQCQRCGAIILEDSANERLDEALRTAAGILKPAEIRQHREALGLTRQQLADLLRISMFTLTRWETGAQIQQRAMDTLLRLFFQSGEARRILGAPGGIAAEGVGATGELMSLSSELLRKPN
jgi:DNA-binding transcriptional regulator YiaG